MIRDLLHEQYDADGDLVVFECDECGYVSMSLGSLHAHIEGHEGFLSFMSRMLPIIGKGFTDPLMDRTNILRIETTEEIELSEVDGL